MNTLWKEQARTKTLNDIENAVNTFLENTFYDNFETERHWRIDSSTYRITDPRGKSAGDKYRVRLVEAKWFGRWRKKQFVFEELQQK